MQIFQKTLVEALTPPGNWYNGFVLESGQINTTYDCMRPYEHVDDGNLGMWPASSTCQVELEP